MSEQKTHAEIIAEMRFHGQQNIDAEKDKPEYGILTMEGRITQNYAAELDAAHKREIEEAKKQIALLSKTLENDNSATATITTVKQETLAAISNEIRGRAKAWPDEYLTRYDLRLADRIDAAAKREATTEKSLGVGNAAKLREALELFAHANDDGFYSANSTMCSIVKRAKAALAAPPRNCDRFGGDIEKLREACLRERGLNPDEDFPEIFCEWLLAAAKKGGRNE